MGANIIVKCSKCHGVIEQRRGPGTQQVVFVEDSAMHDCPPKPDMAALQDRVVELAKDLLMLDTGALAQDLCNRLNGGASFKDHRLYAMVVAFHGARGMAEEFRAAHVAEQKKDLRSAMENQFHDRLREIERGELSPEDIESRRAS